MADGCGYIRGVKKLTGSNYRHWRYHILEVPALQEVGLYVNGRRPYPQEVITDGPEVQERYLKRCTIWEQGDSKATAILLTTIARDVVRSIPLADLATSKEILDFLDRKYENQRPTRGNDIFFLRLLGLNRKELGLKQYVSQLCEARCELIQAPDFDCRNWMLYATIIHAHLLPEEAKRLGDLIKMTEAVTEATIEAVSHVMDRQHLSDEADTKTTTSPENAAAKSNDDYKTLSWDVAMQTLLSGGQPEPQDGQPASRRKGKRSRGRGGGAGEALPPQRHRVQGRGLDSRAYRNDNSNHVSPHDARGIDIANCKCTFCGKERHTVENCHWNPDSDHFKGPESIRCRYRSKLYSTNRERV